MRKVEDSTPDVRYVIDMFFKAIFEAKNVIMSVANYYFVLFAAIYTYALGISEMEIREKLADFLFISTHLFFMFVSVLAIGILWGLRDILAVARVWGVDSRIKVSVSSFLSRGILASASGVLVFIVACFAMASLAVTIHCSDSIAKCYGKTGVRISQNTISIVVGLFPADL
jgi:hypothetical protein